MRFSLIVVTLLFFGCKKQEESPYIDKAQLTCYSGDKIVYQITTQPYKIHNPSSGTNDGSWAIDTDQGKVEITGTCIYKPLNF